MPVEDLIDLVDNYEITEGDIETKKVTSKRKLVFYGTPFSQRDN